MAENKPTIYNTLTIYKTGAEGGGGGGLYGDIEAIFTGDKYIVNELVELEKSYKQYKMIIINCNQQRGGYNEYYTYTNLFVVESINNNDLLGVFDDVNYFWLQEQSETQFKIESTSNRLHLVSIYGLK